MKGASVRFRSLAVRFHLPTGFRSRTHRSVYIDSLMDAPVPQQAKSLLACIQPHANTLNFPSLSTRIEPFVSAGDKPMRIPYSTIAMVVACASPGKR